MLGHWGITRGALSGTKLDKKAWLASSVFVNPKGGWSGQVTPKSPSYVFYACCFVPVMLAQEKGLLQTVPTTV